MTRRFLLSSLAVAALTWSGGASAMDVVVSGAVERGRALSRVEVFASVVLPLDEWFQPLGAMSALLSRSSVAAGAWDDAERTTTSDAVYDVMDLDPTYWAEPEVAPNGTVPPEHPPVTPPNLDAPRPRPVPAPPLLNAAFVRALLNACNREFGTARADLDDLASRARWSAWLPELQLKGGRNTDQTLRLTPTDTEPDRYQVVGGDGVRYEGQVRWSFSQLVFARDELAVARLRGALETEKRKRQQQAMEGLSKWFAAWVVLDAEGVEPQERFEAWVAESAQRAELDWLTHGWFSAQVPSAPSWADLRDP